uniref:PPPDE domain-containing protein n=2 Tax=Cannabis sativa TaxID=3483 RepID=A0A803NMY3_CANSA
MAAEMQEEGGLKVGLQRHLPCFRVETDYLKVVQLVKNIEELDVLLQNGGVAGWRLALTTKIWCYTFTNMKFGLKKGWKSIGPLRLRGKTTTRFCLFSKTKSANYGPGRSPVYLNVYDLTPMNGYVYWAGLGIFHSGVEVHGVEYAFGAHDYPTSGVFEVEPRQCPGFKFRKSIFIGTTCLDPIQVREFMERQSTRYNGDTYHLIIKNCNHFCKDICYKLTGKTIPKWVNRLAKIGSICNCILPEALKIPAVQHDPNCEPFDIDSEKRSLRSSAFSCLSSISMRQKQLSTSSLFLQSPLRGCLPPWELKRSNNGSLKERLRKKMPSWKENL